MGKKSYKKRGGAIIQGAEQLNETTTTDDIPMVNEPMVNKPMVNEPMVKKDEPLNKIEPATNEPKKYVDPSGKEWCECPPPKTSGVETVKNFGKNANDAVKNLQDKTINNITGTISQKSDEIKENLSNKALNLVSNIFGNKEKTVDANKVLVGGRRRRTRKNKHSKHKHKHSKHKHSKHKNCTRKHKHKHKNKNCTRKHKHKHKHSKNSKH